MDTLSKQAKALLELQSGLDAIQDSEKKQKRFDALPKGMQDQLDALWGQLYSDRGRKNIPTSGGRWSGEAGDSIWIPDDQIVPPDKGYSNMQHKTWGQIKRENGISGIRFSDGRVDFSPVTKYAVKFDWEKELGGDGIRYLVQTGDRQYLHEAAFSKLAAKLGKSIEEVKQLKESRNLVWHEEPDCETLQLVVREVHDNIRHFGGIAMLAIIA
jgi:hypothetical protein